MPIVYQIEPNFASFLSFCYEFFNCQIDRITEKNEFHQLELGCEQFFYVSKEMYAKKMKTWLIKNKLYEDFYTAYLHYDDQRLLHLHQFIRLANQLKCNPIDQNHLDLVIQIRNYIRRVRSETHKLTGFLRFSKSRDGIYYAKIKPDCHVIEPLSKHFKERMPAEKWLIHDIGRNLASAYNTNYIEIQAVPPQTVFEEDDEEENYRKLWYTFYHSIAIQSRKKLKLQQANVPLKYRPQMFEFSDLRSLQQKQKKETNKDF